MEDFNEKDLENLSIDEINELYKDIIEMPSPIIAGVASGGSVCLPKGGFLYSQ